MGIFADHLVLVDRFLDERDAVVERIEQALLNVRDKDTSRRRDRPFFERTFEACFFGLARLPVELARLKGQLAARHLADGFEPVVSETAYVNELDPLELILRAYERWEHYRWPGWSGRLGYAHTLYGVFMLRLLEALSLRIWDADAGVAGDRLVDLQARLDRLNAPKGSTVFLRDAGWLIQTAQGPLTKLLRPYFEIADRLAGSLEGASRLAVHKAGARLAGGHLRSQLRYRMWQTGRPLEDPDNLGYTRNSNALDSAILVRDLVPLLEAYREAFGSDDDETRLDLADAILQAVSADPELYLARLDLLMPYVMAEDLFIQTGAGSPRHTAMGEIQVRYLTRYAALVGELAEPLRHDAAAFDPTEAPYSPQGVTYGFVADVLSNMAQEPLAGQSSFGLSLEDMFVSRGSLEHKRARARQWEALPRRPGEREHFGHSIDDAVQSHKLVTDALAARALHPANPNASACRNARIFVTAEPEFGDLSAGAVNANDYCVTTGVARGGANRAARYPLDQFLLDRSEGRYLASARSGDEWCGISKVILTTFISRGTDVLLTEIPGDVSDVLQLTCPELVVERRSRGSAQTPGTCDEE